MSRARGRGARGRGAAPELKPDIFAYPWRLYSCFDSDIQCWINSRDRSEVMVNTTLCEIIPIRIASRISHRAIKGVAGYTVIYGNGTHVNRAA